MTRLNVVLFVALVFSGLYLVRVSYEARRLFVEVERAQSEERALETEFEQLQLEKRAQATPLRVEKVAREKLQMRTATPAVTHYVTHAGATDAPQAASAAAPGGQP
ncbi:cell division protein FtsL [Caldimonas thermodepolymerans]|jgi:cell division protein FtsL|uniref:Cell division protein FtsL n=1 Tax=Caldimonas thermodepolymerans TaxID=215580 RepID=A0A2S5T0U3_9BURK|nr:cell division protein FtsL [Caldimonas thermodepolymerans]PPE68539.1 cell division protein FtsL [Caldimonas thermodepolymerans]QPC30878.1 cell division protein FtsL [Caldimonas thermodepolymerans]RDH97121.1 cell division protein FtsL [Caldimonas thermodepolymerans]TCP08977.1 cell division protein FtsL [Caldimonas thermodepolymerans]UZG43614.1 cell division protein FtsL [Caldimonas thermodepolymerans]